MTNREIGSTLSLKEAFSEHFLIGAAVNPRTITAQEKLLAHHYNRPFCRCLSLSRMV